MRKKSVIAILPIIVAVVCLFSFSPAQAKICDYEVKYFTYMTPNGASSAKLELVGKSLDGIAAKCYNTQLNSRLIRLAEYSNYLKR